MLTRLENPQLLEMALKNSAQDAFYKPTTSGDVLDNAILKAISKVQKDRKRPPFEFNALRIRFTLRRDLGSAGVAPE